LALVFSLGSAAPAVAADNSVHFVWWTDRPYLLISQEQPVGVQYERRQTSLASDGVTLRVVDPIVKGTEGKALAAKVGQSFELRGSSQPTCLAVAQRAVRVSIINGDFGAVPEPSRVNDLTEGARWIALELRPADGGCNPSLYWARPAGGAPLTVVPGVETPTSPRLEDAIATTTMWKAAQKEFTNFDRQAGGEMQPTPNAPLRPGRWDASSGSVEVVRFSSSSQTIMWHQVTAGDGCGDFIGGVIAIWAEVGGLLQLSSPQDKDLENPYHTQSWRPEVAVDLDGDGSLELIGPGVLYKRSGLIWRVQMHAPLLYTADPC
jgi:hypothetical protein